MVTKVIDGAFTGDAFPTTYTGLGTLVGHIVSDGGVGQMTSGYFTSTNEDVRILLGYQPRRITVVNETDAIIWQKNIGMAAANVLKTALAVEVDANSLIVFEDGLAGNYNILLKAALVGNAKAISFIVEG